MTNKLFDLLRAIGAGEKYSKATAPLMQLKLMNLVSLKIRHLVDPSGKASMKVERAVITPSGEAYLAVYGRSITHAKSRRSGSSSS